MDNNVVYIAHIMEAIEKIEKYLRDVSDVHQFVSSDMLFDAVLREMEIIGEAANNIDADFREIHPDIPWKKMISLRNILIHEYFGVNGQIVWDTCQGDLPQLKKLLLPILP